ncbi:hypothetical protein AB1Y20_017889 [Prymnesium parvum]|uniref:DUF1275 domain-containing protein n=1 Tax=Prymnesium parvum TaxID=97485 RepID=A0AB34JQK0_PRYPA
MAVPLLFLLAAAGAARLPHPTRLAAHPALRAAPRSMTIANPLSPPPPRLSPHPPPAPPASHRPFLMSLAFLAGVSDVLCFSKFGCYANMMTGNVISTVASLAALRWRDATFFAAAVLNYVLGFGLFRCLDRRSSRRYAIGAAAVIVFTLFSLCEVLLLLQPRRRWQMVLLAFAFGLINAVSSETTGVVTSMVTGHLQKLSNALADFVDGQAVSSAPSLTVLCSFVAGIAFGSTSSYFLTVSRRLPLISGLGVAYTSLLWLGRGEQATPLSEKTDIANCELDTYETTCL